MHGPTARFPKPNWSSAWNKKLGKLLGNNYEYTQPIQMRFNELIAANRSDVAVKVYGDDFDDAGFSGKGRCCPAIHSGFSGCPRRAGFPASRQSPQSWIARPLPRKVFTPATQQMPSPSPLAAARPAWCWKVIAASMSWCVLLTNSATTLPHLATACCAGRRWRLRGTNLSRWPVARFVTEEGPNQDQPRERCSGASSSGQRARPRSGKLCRRSPGTGRRRGRTAGRLVGLADSSRISNGPAPDSL